jgi:hypothetical protein
MLSVLSKMMKAEKFCSSADFASSMSSATAEK